jgi:hypothetical protein
MLKANCAEPMIELRASDAFDKACTADQRVSAGKGLAQTANTFSLLDCRKAKWWCHTRKQTA